MCGKLKSLVVEIDNSKEVILVLVGKEDVGCVGESGDKAVDDKVRRDDERNARESSPLHGRRLRGRRVTGRKETVRTETGAKEEVG